MGLDAMCSSSAAALRQEPFAEGLVIGSGLSRSISRPPPLATRRWRHGSRASLAPRARPGARSRRRVRPRRCAERGGDAGTAVLVDCLTLWLSNLMEAGLDIGGDRGA